MQAPRALATPRHPWGPVCRRRDSLSGARPSAGACMRPRWSCWPTPASRCAMSRRSRCSAPLAPRWTAAACASPRASWTTRSRARRASGCSSRAAATPHRSSLRDGEVYYGTGSDVLYIRDPDTGERRRVRLADVEGMAALCEVLPHIDFVMSHGPARGRPAGDRRPGAGRRHDAGHAQAAARRAARRHVLAQMQEMAAACGAKDSFASTPCPRRPSCTTPTR